MDRSPCILATGSLLATGFVSIKLYSNALAPATFGVVVVALNILGYVPLLNFGFRTTINQKLLAGAGTAEEAALLRVSQVFYTYLSLIVLAGSILAMLMYARLSNTRLAGSFVFLAISLTVLNRCFPK